eukprot:204259_1
MSNLLLVNSITIHNTLFLSNYCTYNGILSINKWSHGYISNCTFRNNEVGGIGGAIHSKADVLNISRCEFRNNIGAIHGGHIAQYQNELFINECVFKSGQAIKGNGGAIWISGFQKISSITTKIYNTIFEANYAGFHGGAILQDAPLQYKKNGLLLTNVDFRMNYAGHSGSAIYIYNPHNMHNVQFIMDNTVTYFNNTADVINSDLQSRPITYTLTSNQTQICPGCVVSLTVSATNIIGESWIPHSYYDAILSNGSYVMIPTYKSSNSIIYKIFSNQKNKMIGGLKIINQSKHWHTGVGTEFVTFGPAIFNDTITLTIITKYSSLNISFNIVDCSVHMGARIIGENDFFCELCTKDTYRFNPTHNDECKPCPSGGICEGGPNVYVKNDYYPFVTEHGLEIAACVAGTCCLRSSCLWNEIDQLCPEHRNGSSPMCSKCNDGYSVAPLSAECVNCNSVNWWYFILPTFGYALLIWWWGHSHPLDGKLAAWEIYTFRILSFYYQILPAINTSVNMLIDDSETSNSWEIFEGIFNFNPKIASLCAYKNLDNLQQILLSFVTPITCLFWICLMWIFRFNSKYCKIVFKFFVFKAWTKFFLQVYAQLTRTSFALLACREFKYSGHRMYYSGDIECYQWWHTFAFLGAIITICLPFFALYRLIVARKALDRTAWWHILTLGYKRRCWWYRIFRMFCRLAVILLIAIPISESYRLVLLRWLVFVFLIVHIWVQPFDTKKYSTEIIFDINHLETFCLILLCVLVMLADYDQANVTNIYTILKSLPMLGLPLLVIYKMIAKKFMLRLVPKNESEIEQMKTIRAFYSVANLQLSDNDELEMEMTTMNSTKNILKTDSSKPIKSGTVDQEGEIKSDCFMLQQHIYVLTQNIVSDIDKLNENNHNHDNNGNSDESDTVYIVSDTHSNDQEGAPPYFD